MPATDGQCPYCSGDMGSAIAEEVATSLQNPAPGGLVCPGCGSTRGFRPYAEQVSVASGPLLVGWFTLIFGCLGPLLYSIFRLGVGNEFQCLECQMVFQPRNRVREVFIITLVGLAIVGLLLLAMRSE